MIQLGSYFPPKLSTHTFTSIAGPQTIMVSDLFNYSVSSSRAVAMSSVQFSRSVVSNSLQSHEPQHARSSCPSPIPRVYPNSCPLSQ